MFYRRFMHQNIHLLLNKAASLCPYDQVYAIIEHWQHNLLSLMRNTKQFRGICGEQESAGDDNLPCTQRSKFPRVLSPSLASEAAGIRRITPASDTTNHHPQFAFKTSVEHTVAHNLQAQKLIFLEVTYSLKLPIGHLQKNVPVKEEHLTTCFTLSIYSLC